MGSCMHMHKQCFATISNLRILQSILALQSIGSCNSILGALVLQISSSSSPYPCRLSSSTPSMSSAEAHGMGNLGRNVAHARQFLDRFRCRGQPLCSAAVPLAAEALGYFFRSLAYASNSFFFCSSLCGHLHRPPSVHLPYTKYLHTFKLQRLSTLLPPSPLISASSPLR